MYNAETGAPERRRTARVRVADGAQAIVASSGSVRVLDISAGGVLLASTRPALVGTRGRLSLTVAGNPWAAMVEICRVVPSSDRVGTASARRSSTSVRHSATRSSDSPASSRPGARLSPVTKSAVQLIGQSAEIVALRQEVERVARSDAKVLITGESGVGKEIVARAIHSHGPRAAHVFAPVNCAGLPETLLESELFGHVKGSFTGAYRDKPGKLEAAHNGHHLPRRSRRDDAAHAGAAAAVPRDRRAAEGRRRRRRPRRQRARHRRHQPQPARHDRAGHVPRRPVLPPERHPHRRCRRCASAARTSRCWRTISCRSSPTRIAPEVDVDLAGRDEGADSSTPGRATSASSRTSSSGSWSR